MLLSPNSFIFPLILLTCSEAERVHCRWAMLGVAGILAQEIVHPDVFWYTSGATMELPIPLPGLLAFELFVMHWVESKRGYDLKNPGSQDQDPIFSQYKLPAHEVGYPGKFYLFRCISSRFLLISYVFLNYSFFLPFLFARRCVCSLCAR